MPEAGKKAFSGCILAFQRFCGYNKEKQSLERWIFHVEPIGRSASQCPNHCGVLFRYLYLDFSSYFQETGLDGFANWYQVQAQEEQDHAMLFYQYLHNNSAKVALEAVAKPERKAADTMGILKAGLEHEVYVTSLIHNLYDAAQQSKKISVRSSFWIGSSGAGEEEKNAEDLIQKMELFRIGGQGTVYAQFELAAECTRRPAWCCKQAL